MKWPILALLIFSCGAHGAEREKLTEDERAAFGVERYEELTEEQRGTLFVVRTAMQSCGTDTVHGVGATAVGGVRMLRIACFDQGGSEHRFVFRLWVGNLPTLEAYSTSAGRRQ